jgi:hypothetical protein
LNSIEILGPRANGIKIFPATNDIEVSSFDIYTTTYFLQAYMTLKKHSSAKTSEEPSEENGNEEPEDPEEGEPEDEL